MNTQRGASGQRGGSGRTPDHPSRLARTRLTAARVILTSTLAALATLIAPPPDATAAPGFPHAIHLDKIRDCTTCHRMSAATGWAHAGRIDHAACDAPGCHARDYSQPTDRRRRLRPFCQTCHVDILRRIYVFPPWRGSLDRAEPSLFAIPAFDHGAHQRQGAPGCAQCHVARAGSAAPGPAPEFATVGHDTCGQSICHAERVAPRMADCTRCHVLGDAARPARATHGADPYRVESGFSHAAHRAAAGEAACDACHLDTDPGRGQPVRLPRMAACAACHDGTTAFSTTGTDCGRCHVRPEAPHAR